MALREELARSGTWLFQYRSWIPPLLLVPLILAAADGRPGTRLGLDPVPTGIGLAVALAGMVVRALVVGHAPTGTSGKNRALQVAESLTTTGLYSVVRHPLYLGNFLLWLGPSLATGTWWCPILISLAYWLVYERIMFTEEDFLRRSFGDRYLAWAAATPAVVPAFRHWRAPALPFSIRTVLRQEYYALFSTVFLFFVLEVGTARLEAGRFELSRPWLAAVGAAALVSGGLRVLQRYTSVLDVEGR